MNAVPAADSLHHQAIRLNVAVASLPAAVIVVDATGIVREANPHAVRVLECRAADVLGVPIASLVAPLDWLKNRREAPRTERFCNLTLPSGRKVILGFSMAEVEGGNGSQVLLFQDITHWQQVREERDRLIKVAAVGAALPTLLHEIRNPLASVAMAVELLLEDAAPGRMQERLGAILGEVRRMKLSMDGVGAVGRDLRGQRPAPLDHACREAWAIMCGRAAAANIHMRSNIAHMPLIPLDPAVLSAIVYNLAINAIQACCSGCTVSLTASLEDGGNVFEMRVVDNGPGMTQEVLERATELFFTTKRSGSGIGLALCKRAVEDAGGTFVITSVPGYGTSVTLRVPLAPRPQGTRPQGEP